MPRPGPGRGLSLKDNAMHVTVNGQQETAEVPLRLDELLRRRGAAPGRVAALVNGEVVRAADWPARELRDGDRVELLTLAGGG